MRSAIETTVIFGLCVGLVSTSALLAGDTPAAPEKAAPKAASPGFEKIKALAGEWTAKGAGEHAAPLKVSYALTSAGSAVVETMDTGDHGSMVTVYHPDGDAVMLTHYCASGNQPRMRAKGGDKELAFAFVDATNLSSPDAMHMHDLKVTFDDADHITEEWTTAVGGKRTPMVLKLARQK
jgi:hypothetical protein